MYRNRYDTRHMIYYIAGRDLVFRSAHFKDVQSAAVPIPIVWTGLRPLGAINRSERDSQCAGRGTKKKKTIIRSSTVQRYSCAGRGFFGRFTRPAITPRIRSYIRVHVIRITYKFEALNLYKNYKKLLCTAMYTCML